MGWRFELAASPAAYSLGRLRLKVSLHSLWRLELSSSCHWSSIPLFITGWSCVSSSRTWHPVALTSALSAVAYGTLAINWSHTTCVPLSIANQPHGTGTQDLRFAHFCTLYVDLALVCTPALMHYFRSTTAGATYLRLGQICWHATDLTQH